jgi:hypothetical protein
MESECFGIPRGGTIVALAIGLIIVLWGLFAILAPDVNVWPIAVIIFGILIAVGALYGLSRRH